MQLFRLIFIGLILLCLLGNTPGMAEPAPSWVSGLTAGEWQAISLNTLADIDPEDIPALNSNHPNSAPWRGTSGQTSVFNTWNGGALASGYGEKGALLIHGGGNNGYYGSEIYAFDLDKRLWERATDPFPGPINFPYAEGVYPDGSPVPTHTYDYLNYHPGTNSFIIFSGNRDASLRTWVTNEGRAYVLNLNTKTWTHSPHIAQGQIRYGGNSCFDRNRDVFWILGESDAGSSSSKFFKYDPSISSGDPFTYYTGQSFGLDAVAACDPIRDLYIYANFRNDPKNIYAKDLKTPDAGAVQINESGTVPTKVGQAGWEWSNALEAIVYWPPGENVYQLKLSGTDWRTDTWVWSNLTSAGNTVTPDDTDSGGRVYSRFRIAVYDEAEIAIVCNKRDGAVFAFLIPDSAGGIKRPNPPSNLQEKN